MHCKRLRPGGHEFPFRTYNASPRQPSRHGYVASYLNFMPRLYSLVVRTHETPDIYIQMICAMQGKPDRSFGATSIPRSGLLQVDTSTQLHVSHCIADNEWRCWPLHKDAGTELAHIGYRAAIPLQDGLIRALQLVIAKASPAVRNGGIVPHCTARPFAAGSNTGSARRIAGQLGGLGGSHRARTLSHAGRREATHTGHPNGSHLSITYLKNGRDGGIRTRDLLLPNQPRPVA
jgi:hypothetical protein